MSPQAPVMVTVTEVAADVSAATLGVSVYLEARDEAERDEAARSATTRPHASGRAILRVCKLPPLLLHLIRKNTSPQALGLSVPKAAAV